LTIVHQDGYIRYIRQQVGHELIYLVYTTGIILNQDGHILVQRRYEFDWWDLVGGAKEINETISACIIREAYEECGLHIKIERLVGVYSHPQYTMQYPHGDRVQPWSVCFVCRVVGGVITPDGKETLSAQFKPLAEILPHPHPIFDRMLRDAFPDGNTQHPTSQMMMESAFAQEDVQPFFPVLRRYIPHAPIILPGALMLVRDDAGKILVTKRSAFDVWDLPGGFSDLGENATHTALREVREETGLLVEPLRALGVYSDPTLMYAQYPNGDQVYGVGLWLEGRVVGGSLHADGVETSAVAFMDAATLRAQPNLRPITRQLLEDIEHLDQQPFLR